eukprot:GHRR01009006.1.p1 GENE.GHRR01009006.1~~GHRR01009006.1.p1  ORF type:complete len:212 (+),score=57.68 GHRR01009006.1:488-1123(+)
MIAAVMEQNMHPQLTAALLKCFAQYAEEGMQSPGTCPVLQPDMHSTYAKRGSCFLALHLPAARTKLRKLLAAKEAGAGAGNGAANGRGAGLAERSPHAKSSYDVSEFDALIGQYESLKWRMISKPGGAVVKPDDFYRLYALHMQATQGDNTSERPMWAEKGGLDFEGRARWDAWSAVKGLEADKAKLRFVRTYYEFPPGALYADTRGGVTA